ncbi:DUF6538 domain-containing protein [Paroceanicella profunda]|uniref:DUF6538 domain-containing protein n=1 Tax=Paroceanicella profunda TaxID=2579971 RepID=UPI003D2C9F1A
MRRGQAYCLRAAVPAALRPALGKREITRSLKTRDPREAPPGPHRIRARRRAVRGRPQAAAPRT